MTEPTKATMLIEPAHLAALVLFAERGVNQELAAIDPRHFYTDAEKTERSARFGAVNAALKTSRAVLDGPHEQAGSIDHTPTADQAELENLRGQIAGVKKLVRQLSDYDVEIMPWHLTDQFNSALGWDMPRHPRFQTSKLVALAEDVEAASRISTDHDGVDPTDPTDQPDSASLALAEHAGTVKGLRLARALMDATITDFERDLPQPAEEDSEDDPDDLDDDPDCADQNSPETLNHQTIRALTFLFDDLQTETDNAQPDKPNAYREGVQAGLAQAASMVFKMLPDHEREMPGQHPTTITPDICGHNDQYLNDDRLIVCADCGQVFPPQSVNQVPLFRPSIRQRWKSGERVEYVGRNGEPNHPGTVTAVEDYLRRHERLIITFDDGETRSINPDVMRHLRPSDGESLKADSIVDAATEPDSSAE